MKKPPLWLYRILAPLASACAFPLAIVLAIRGRYPWWFVTPDDTVSPFGCGTTPSASREPTMMRIYARFGRYVGDVVWLGWRNKMFGLSYWMKPDWLKEPGIRYIDLDCWSYADGSGTVIELRQPDGTLLRERTRRLGPIYLIYGHRLAPILSGKREDEARVEAGEQPVPRPSFQPNVDGRPIVTLRTRRTM